MPRLILLNNNRPGGYGSFLMGAAEGIGQSLVEGNRERRAMAQRRQIIADQQARDDANYNRSRADRQADTADSRAHEQQQYSTRRSDILADQLQARNRSAEEAGVQQDFYEGAGLLPSETQMPEGVQGPGLRPARLPTREGVDAAASRYGAAQGRQMTQADREADNERADASLEQRAGTAAEMAAYRQKSLGLREQAQQGTDAYRGQMLGLSADRLAEMKRGAAERKAARDAAVKRLTPDQQIKVQQWDRELDYLYKLRDDEELRIIEGWTAQQVLDEIANAEGEQRKIVGSAPQQPANTDPVSAMTDEQLRALIGS